MSGAPASLSEFLARAYDGEMVRRLVESRMLRASQSLAALVPGRAFLTKDGRVVVGYRLEIAGGDAAAQRHVPVFLHYCAESKLDVLRAYRDQPEPEAYGATPDLKHSFVREGEDVFLAAYPLDPELKSLAWSMKPSHALELQNGLLRIGSIPQCTLVESELLGYRPERRAVFRVRALHADGSSSRAVWKFYRRGQAERVAGVAAALRPALHDSGFLTWPEAISPEDGAIAYALRDGETLHRLTEAGWASESDYAAAGELLRRLHSADTGAVRGALPVFTGEDEVAIVERWRRAMKKGGLEASGVLGKGVARLGELLPDCPRPSCPVHRDFYQKQLLVHPWTREMALIDIDTIAMGPPEVDLANMLVHIDLAVVSGQIREEEGSNFGQAFLCGYGLMSGAGRGLGFFEYSTALRLLALAETGPEAATLGPGLRQLCRKKLRNLQ